MKVYVLEFCTGAGNTHVFSTLEKAQAGLAQACELCEVPVPELNPTWCIPDVQWMYRTKPEHGAITGVYITVHELDAVITQTS